VTLSWVAEWASGFRLDPPGQLIDRAVTRLSVAPGRTTTYQLTARGLNSPAREVTVAVGAVIASLGLTAQPGRPHEMVLAWGVECGAAALEVWAGDGPAPGRAAPVPPAGDQAIPLPEGQLTSIRLSASGGGVTAAATLHVAGPVAQGGAVLESLALASLSGITSERSRTAVSWQSQGLLSGQIRDAHSVRELRGATGQAELGLGYRVTRQPLWTGDIYLRAGHPDRPRGARHEGQPPAHAAGDRAEPLGAWAARVLAANEVGLRWEVS
jgi:hypothetical protein